MVAAAAAAANLRSFIHNDWALSAKPQAALLVDSDH